MCEKRDKIRQSRIELINAMRAHLPPELNEVIDRIESDDKGHLLSWSMDNPQQVSYAAQPAHVYDPVKRMRTSLGRYLGRQYGVEITPTINSAIERIFGEIAYDDGRFAVRTDVYDVYSEVASSCMTEMDCVRFYERNGVRVVCYTPPGEDKPIARALLWNTDKGEFLDRIYPNSGPHIEHYHKWAEKRGCAVREHNSMGRTCEDYTVHNIKVGPMPYLDTICYLNGTTLSTRAIGLCCHNTDGAEPTTCNNCGDMCFYDEEYGGDYCEDCAQSRNWCERCEEHTFDDTTEIDGRQCCEGCAQDASSCDRCGENTFETSTVDGQDVCSGCAECACDCDRCGNPVFDRTEINGLDVCSDCEGDAVECDQCGNNTFDDMTYVGDKSVCECCAQDTQECEECGDSYFAADGGLPILNGGRELCACCDTAAQEAQAAM